MKYIIILLFLSSCASKKYYDGEGNVIPEEAVRLLVRDQFIISNPYEDSILKKYFYFRNIKP
jgi:hypothetical protein